MNVRALAMIFLVSQPLLAAAPALPDFIVEYLHQAGLKYEIPIGRFEDYWLTLLNEDNKPEPWAVSADFNGDGIEDWSGLLRDQAGKLDLVVVYSARAGFTHDVLTPLGPDGDNLDAGVVIEPAGRIDGFPVNGDDTPKITTTHPAVHLFYFEKASVLYYWGQGSFHEFVTSD